MKNYGRTAMTAMLRPILPSLWEVRLFSSIPQRPFMRGGKTMGWQKPRRHTWQRSRFLSRYRVKGIHGFVEV